MQFNSERSSGGRDGLYPTPINASRSLSYNRLLQGKQGKISSALSSGGSRRPPAPLAIGVHTAASTPRSYWIEADYRLQAFGRLQESFIGRMEPVFRMDQTFRLDNSTISDGVSLVAEHRANFGFDYNLPHNTRILTSYARPSPPLVTTDVWETGIVYRFLFRPGKRK